MNTVKGLVYGQLEPAPATRDAWGAKRRKGYMWVYYYEIHGDRGQLLASDNACGWRGIYDACIRRIKEIESARDVE